MNRKTSSEIKRGQAISFRIPSDTPDHLLKQIQRLKETERRNFSSKMAEFVLAGVNSTFKREQEVITIPLPRKLNKSQRDWLKHEHSEAILGSIVYQLLSDPIRATTLLASLNSKSVDINEALYLQEEPPIKDDHGFLANTEPAEMEEKDDLSQLDWERLTQDRPDAEEAHDEQGDDLDSLLGDFLEKMNK